MKRAVKNLRSMVRRIANDLRRDFAVDLERDQSRFKRRVIGLLQAELPPKPGRPCSRHISLAVAMRERGESWRGVYCACVPPDLSGDSRQVAQALLRAAVRARLRRSRHRHRHKMGLGKRLRGTVPTLPVSKSKECARCKANQMPLYFRQRTTR